MKGWAVMLLLAGCTTTATLPRAPQKHPAVIAPKIHPVPACSRLDRGLLKVVRKAEGPIANVADVAEKRGEQVEVLNAQLMGISKALIDGCITDTTSNNSGSST